MSSQTDWMETHWQGKMAEELGAMTVMLDHHPRSKLVLPLYTTCRHQARKRIRWVHSVLVPMVNREFGYGLVCGTEIVREPEGCYVELSPSEPA